MEFAMPGLNNAQSLMSLPACVINAGSILPVTPLPQFREIPAQFLEMERLFYDLLTRFKTQ